MDEHFDRLQDDPKSTVIVPFSYVKVQKGKVSTLRFRTKINLIQETWSFFPHRREGSQGYQETDGSFLLTSGKLNTTLNTQNLWYCEILVR